MPYKVNDRTLPMDVPFSLEDKNFPANWLRLSTSEDRAKLGIKWEQPPELQFKDERFYRNWVEDGKVVSKPRDLDQLKRQMLADCRRVAHAMLSGSDWMVIRREDVGDPIPSEWQTWRELVRYESTRQEQQINEAKDVEALANIVPNWPMSPDDEAMKAYHEAERRAAGGE